MQILILELKYNQNNPRIFQIYIKKPKPNYRTSVFQTC